MSYLRRTSNYPERITLCDLTHMMSMSNLGAISVDYTYMITDDARFHLRVFIHSMSPRIYVVT